MFSDWFERIVSHSEVIQFDGLSTFRPCGRDPRGVLQQLGAGDFRPGGLLPSRA